MANYSYPNPLIGKAPKNFRRAGDNRHIPEHAMFYDSFLVQLFKIAYREAPLFKAPTPIEGQRLGFHPQFFCNNISKN